MLSLLGNDYGHGYALGVTVLMQRRHWAALGAPILLVLASQILLRIKFEAEIFPQCENQA